MKKGLWKNWHVVFNSWDGEHRKFTKYLVLDKTLENQQKKFYDSSKDYYSLTVFTAKTIFVFSLQF